MAKGRSKTKANAIKLSKASVRGVVYLPDGRMLTPYEQGYQAYFNGMINTEAYNKGDQFWLGWRKAYDSDKLRLKQAECYNPTRMRSVDHKIQARMMAAFGVAA